MASRPTTYPRCVPRHHGCHTAELGVAGVRLQGQQEGAAQRANVGKIPAMRRDVSMEGNDVDSECKCRAEGNSRRYSVELE